MVSFTGEDQYRVGTVPVPPPTSVPFDKGIADANSGTFYSALSNVDFEIGAGNAGAVAVRFRVAQHGFLRHIDFRLGSGLAASWLVARATMRAWTAARSGSVWAAVRAAASCSSVTRRRGWP
eukprot:gene29178-38650_t